MNKIRLVVASLLLGAATGFAQKPFNASGTGNPIIPGYFADPTVKKFGDTYYMYATTDGSGIGKISGNNGIPRTRSIKRLLSKTCSSSQQ